MSLDKCKSDEEMYVCHSLYVINLNYYYYLLPKMKFDQIVLYIYIYMSMEIRSFEKEIMFFTNYS